MIRIDTLEELEHLLRTLFAVGASAVAAAVLLAVRHMIGGHK